MSRTIAAGSVIGVRPPVEQRPPVLAAEDVRAQEIRGRAPRERAEDPHRGVLQARRRERDDGHWLAGDREVAVRDVDRGLLVRAREPLRRRVAAVIDERLVQPSEARRGIRDDIFEPERLQHVDHEVGAGVLDGQRVAVGVERSGLGRQTLRGLRRRQRRRHARAVGRAAAPRQESREPASAAAAAPLKNLRRSTREPDFAIRLSEHAPSTVLGNSMPERCACASRRATARPIRGQGSVRRCRGGQAAASVLSRCERPRWIRWMAPASGSQVNRM